MSFRDTFLRLNAGKFAAEVDQEFTDLVGSCRATGKKGKIVIELTVKPGRGGSSTVQVDYDCKAKSPQFDRPTDHFFATGQNTLVENNPNQPELDLRPIQRNEGPIVAANPQAGNVAS